MQAEGAFTAMCRRRCTALSIGLQRLRVDCDVCRYVTCGLRWTKTLRWGHRADGRRQTASSAAVDYTKPRYSACTGRRSVVYSPYALKLIVHAHDARLCWRFALHAVRLWNPYRLIHSPICIVCPLIVDAADRHRRLYSPVQYAPQV